MRRFLFSCSCIALVAFSPVSAEEMTETLTPENAEQVFFTATSEENPCASHADGGTKEISLLQQQSEADLQALLQQLATKKSEPAQIIVTPPYDTLALAEALDARAKERDEAANAAFADLLKTEISELKELSIETNSHALDDLRARLQNEAVAKTALLTKIEAAIARERAAKIQLDTMETTHAAKIAKLESRFQSLKLSFNKEREDRLEIARKLNHALSEQANLQKALDKQRSAEAANLQRTQQLEKELQASQSVAKSLRADISNSQWSSGETAKTIDGLRRILTAERAEKASLKSQISSLKKQLTYRLELTDITRQDLVKTKASLAKLEANSAAAAKKASQEIERLKDLLKSQQAKQPVSVENLPKDTDSGNEVAALKAQAAYRAKNTARIRQDLAKAKATLAKLQAQALVAKTQSSAQIQDLTNQLQDQKAQYDSLKDTHTADAQLAAKKLTYLKAQLAAARELNDWYLETLRDAGRSTGKPRLLPAPKICPPPQTITKTLTKTVTKIVKLPLEPKVAMMRMSSDLLFKSGSANLSEQGAAQVDRLKTKLVKMIADLPEGSEWQVSVEGHADKTPITYSAYRFKSNWGLSMARATAVVQQLTANSSIDQTRIKAIAFGEHRPINDGEDAKALAENRRVEIKLVSKP